MEISQEELAARGVVAGCPISSEGPAGCAAIMEEAPGCASIGEGATGCASIGEAAAISDTMPIIGIVPTYKPDTGSMELPDRYVQAVLASGGAPVVIPFSSEVAIYQTLLPNIDGFLLSGGQDIDPVRYGEAITFGKSEELAPGREEVEYLIISFARMYDVPVLGICRGMQMINVAFGGKLYQDLDEESSRKGHWQTEDYSKPTHDVLIEPGTKLHGVLGTDRAKVNSMHHQGIRELAPGLVASAHDDTGLIEAVESPDLTFMIGVQWHPEFFAREGQSMAPMMSRLVDAADQVRHRNKRCRSCLSIMRKECGGCFPSISFSI